ncbi:MAG: hypothetical protein H7Y30_14550, partial [Pyrinomonadaceae bacterium]|nr:hypothetical protein [Pyrinomonadaceae bacterium]
PDAQGKASGGSGKVSTPAPAATASARVTITAATSPMDLARAAYLAQGGDKFRDLKSMVLKGSVDLYAPNSIQSLAGSFVIVMAGARSRIEIQSPAFNLRQISNGQQTYASIPGMQMPDPNKFGIHVLTKYDQPGYAVSALPDNKKHRAFRITDPDGNITDFTVDPANGRVMSYLSPYAGYTFGQENKSLKEVDGVLVPYSFTQRLEMRQGAAFADFKVKDAKLNQEIADDVFDIPEN